MHGSFPSFARIPDATRRALLWLWGPGGRRARVLLYIFAGLLLLDLAATLVTGLLLGRRLDALRGAGISLEVTDYFLEVPAGEPNAADVYQRAFDVLRVSEEERRKLTSQTHLRLLAREERLTFARSVVPPNEQYFALLDEAAGIHSCAFQIDYNQREPFATTFPHLKHLREAGDMLELRALLLAAEGRDDDALTCCGTMFRLAEHTQKTPLLIAQLVAYSIHERAAETLEHVVTAGTPSAEVCKSLFDQLADVDQGKPFMSALDSELAWSIAIYGWLRKAPLNEVAGLLFEGMQGVPDSGWMRAGAWVYTRGARPLLNLDELAYVHGWGRYRQAMAAPWPEAEQRCQEIDAWVNDLLDIRALAVKVMVPIYCPYRLRRDESEARVGAAQIGLALEAWRTDRGRYPESLDDVEAAGWHLPSDPFGGAPFHYRKQGDGFVVWSVGPDMDDDGAKLDLGEFHDMLPSEREGRSEDDCDVIFLCAR